MKSTTGVREGEGREGRDKRVNDGNKHVCSAGRKKKSKRKKINQKVNKLKGERHV